MGNSILASLYWMVVALFSHYTDGCIKFAASPSTFNLAYTKEIFVKCSMMHTQTVNVSSIASISISRSRANQSSTVLGIIEKSKGDKFSGVDGVSDVVTNGYFDNKNVSSLTLLWKRPSLDDVGEYTCQFAGRDKNGMTFNLTESLTITYEIPTALCPKGNERWQKWMNRKFFTPEIYKGSHYYISRDMATDSSAAGKECEEHGGYLVEIGDKTELNVAVQLARKHSLSKVLIAGTDAEKEGTWVFPRTGAKVQYFNWDEDEPNDSKNEDCIVIQYAERNDQLNDVSCQGSFNYICELEGK